MSDLNEALFVAVDDFVRRAVKPLNERIEAQEATIKRLETVTNERAPVGDVAVLRELLEAQRIHMGDLESRLAALPVPKNGKDAEPVDVAKVIDEVVKRIPVPKDGTSVSVDEVSRIIRDLVEPALEALPVPKDGKSVEMAEVVALVETAVKALPVPKDGENGTSVDVAVVRAMVADAVKALPVPKDGEDGKSVDPVEIRAMVAEAVKAIPAAKDGTPGTNGADGVSVTDATIDSDGVLLLTLSDGILLRTGKVWGERGLRGEKGDNAVLDPTLAKSLVAEIVPGIVEGSANLLELRVKSWLPDIKREAKGDPGKTGEPGKAGESGASAYAVAKAGGFSGSEAEWLLSLRGKDGAAAINGKDGAPGINGSNGTNGSNGKDGRSAVEIAREHGFAGSDLDWLVSLHGKDGDDGASILSALVDEFGELVLTASDGTRHKAGVVRGRNGTDGVNGSLGDPGAPGRDAVAIRLLPAIEDAKSYPAGSWAVHAGGSWYAEQATEPLAGRSPQKAGWTPSAIGEKSFSIELAEDLRTIVTKKVTSTDLTIERRFKVPIVLDRGVFTAGKQYERGDQVTSRGSYFIAKVDKPAGVPGMPGADDWRMTIKGLKV